MSRGEERRHRPPEPWFCKAVTVQQQHRIRIPAGEIAPFVPWLPRVPGTTWCPAFGGPWGQLRLMSAFPQESEDVRTRLQEADIPEESSAEPGLRYVRARATYWMVAVGAEAAKKGGADLARYTFQLPEEARIAGYAPRTGEGAMIFVLGPLFEIWRADEWRRHVGESAQAEVTYRESLEAWL